MQAWDRYAYTNSSPVNFTDPTGHFIPWSKALGQFWNLVNMSINDAMGPNANNFGGLFVRGLRDFSHANITGQALDQIKEDPAIIEAQEDILKDKNPTERKPTRVDLSGDGSLFEQVQDENFWNVNVGHLSATSVQVNSGGKETVTWSLTDIFDFRPIEKSEYRNDNSRAKNNLLAYIFGGIYHDVLGATDQMTTSATWTTSVCPDGSETRERDC